MSLVSVRDRRPFQEVMSGLNAKAIGNDGIRSRLRGPVKDDHAGRLSHAIQIGSSVDMAPALRDLIALHRRKTTTKACEQGDLLFVAIFGAACAVTIIQAIRRLR